MEKISKLYKIMLAYLNSCLEFNLPKLFNRIKQKLESEADTIKFIYFNRNWFHNILYDREELIKIEFNEQKNNLYYGFYLDLLIIENPLCIFS